MGIKYIEGKVVVHPIHSDIVCNERSNAPDLTIFKFFKLNTEFIPLLFKDTNPKTKPC